MAIKFTKNMTWLKPYVYEVKDLVNINRIKKIRGFRVNPNCDEWTDAQIIPDKKGTKFTITIKTHTQLFKSTKLYKSFYKYTPLSYSQVLDSLAHEIAHIKVYSHSLKHLELQLKIFKRFIKVMKAQGIKDTWQKIPKETKKKD